MSATLLLERNSAHLMELRRRTFEVLIDGSRVGSIDSHHTLEKEVERGRHTLKVQEGRYTSRELAFVAGEGDQLKFRCNGAKIWPVWLASFVVPRLALSLSREE